MSAVPTPPPAPDTVNIEIDGVPMAAPKGSMIIQAADRAGIPIPRFCYHAKLSIAANCRMCLVDVEKAPKPMPACATPVMEGMKVYTQSKRALDSQRNVMEFLLINHPLDCPICDQGGECELQDLSMGYGRSVSRFSERKRVLPDEDVGPLVATDMTRCIQCTRCVRFLSEIAGSHEFGGMGRGEDLSIGTYIGRNIGSELSGNVIDVCPVGALTNKPFRFRARAWELTARPSIGYHDALGSHLHLHLCRDEVLRSVPRDNEVINENWLSDRDRYSHAGLAGADRLGAPLLRDAEGGWRQASWDEALAEVAGLLQTEVGEALGILVHPATSNEEGALLAALAHGLGSSHIDHRIGIQDFADQPLAMPFEAGLDEVESADAILLLGCNPRLEAPILGHRVRKAWKRGAKVAAINPIAHEFHYELAQAHTVTPDGMVDALLGLARAACEEARSTPPAGLATALGAAPVDPAWKPLVATLRAAGPPVLLLGEALVCHPQASLLRALARHIAECVGARVNELPQGANAVGLARHGVLPSGLDAAGMMVQARRAYLLYGIEPEFDFADGAAAHGALTQAGTVVAFAAYASPLLREVADAILPIGLLPETDATLTNALGLDQAVAAAARPPEQARPGWRVLRALGGLLGFEGFEFDDLAALRAELRAHALNPGVGIAAPATPGSGLQRVGLTPIYRSDAVVRRAAPLQAHPLNPGPCLRLHPEDALARGLGDGALAQVDDGRGKAVLPVVVSNTVARGSAAIDRGFEATAALAPHGAWLQVERAGAE